MCSCVEWSVKDWDVESQLCTLSWDYSVAQRNPSSRPSSQHEQFTARAHSSARYKTPLWMITELLKQPSWHSGSSFSQAETHYYCSRSFTPLLELYSQPDANLQLNNKYKFDCGVSWNVKTNYIQSTEPWITHLIITWNIDDVLHTLRDQALLISQCWSSHLSSKHNWLNSPCSQKSHHLYENTFFPLRKYRNKTLQCSFSGRNMIQEWLSLDHLMKPLGIVIVGILILLFKVMLIKLTPIWFW